MALGHDDQISPLVQRHADDFLGGLAEGHTRMASAGHLPNDTGKILPRQCFDAIGGVTDNTGQGPMRVTFSVIPALISQLDPRRRCGDGAMMLRLNSGRY